ncbi:MAG: Rieske (2Fe-2S) protein [Pedosphaera sp.]|nr:Rieske (2Fe-2S) protein [Pedosphaera sp.]PHX94226.1 MAG: Rieske (2Fe-2S) protein [Pedosphaera sp.]
MTRTQPLCPAADLPPGRTLKFAYTDEGIQRAGFAANVRGHLVAYENACRHIPMPLDDDNDFFTTDGEFFICRTHGAIYEPLNGRCIHGPCGGLSLKPLRVVEVEGELRIVLPEAPA